MTVSETLTHSSQPDAPDQAAAWLATRPGEELTEIVERGIQGGELFYAANREVQRRAALADQAARAARAAELRRNRLMALLAILALVVCAYFASAMLIAN